MKTKFMIMNRRAGDRYRIIAHCIDEILEAQRRDQMHLINCSHANFFGYKTQWPVEKFQSPVCAPYFCNHMG